MRLDPARNAAATPRVRFTFDDDGYRRVMEVEREGLEVGIFHSHPASPAYPSATDRARDERHLAGLPAADDQPAPGRHRRPGDQRLPHRPRGGVAVEDLRLVEDCATSTG